MGENDDYSVECFNKMIYDYILALTDGKTITEKSTFYYPTFQLDWTKDNYDINIDTKAYLFGIPTYINNQTLNIIGKEAINLRFGLNILKNNWSFVASFSQHIPYKIDLKEKIIPKEEEKKEEIYGGGLFQLSITKYLD